MHLDVPGASIHYEVRGHGPPLLLIPGAAGDGRSFTPLTDQLLESRTVITYDRRGYSRSVLHGPQDHERRLATDADDARRLIRGLGEEPAAVFGTSSGGVVALRLLLDHPSSVALCVVHEPAVFALLPEAEGWGRWFDHVYDIYRSQGAAQAVAAHRERAFPATDRRAMESAPTTSATARANATHWLEDEMRQYTSAALDTAALREVDQPVIPVVGGDSTGYPTARIAERLGVLLGRPAREVPGGHVGYLTHTEAFARALRTILEP